jgi:hypothetical protein
MTLPSPKLALSGSCLCGGVRFTVTGPMLEASHCHCSRCRKQHGAAFSTYGAFDRPGLEISGGDNIVRYPSTEQVTRAFCGTCGSPLLWEHAGLPKVVWIALGTLDSPRELVIDGHIWTSAKVAWCEADVGLPAHAESMPPADVIALMAARRRAAGSEP